MWLGGQGRMLLHQHHSHAKIMHLSAALHMSLDQRVLIARIGAVGLLLVVASCNLQGVCGRSKFPQFVELVCTHTYHL
jgi:hypothetical protein